MSKARINPKHREKLDFERFAEAMLDLAPLIDDEELRRIGREIRKQLESKKRSAA